MKRGKQMKTTRRTLMNLSLTVLLAVGAIVVLPGCKKHDNVGNKLDRAADKVGNAAEKAGDKVDNAL